MIDVTHVPGRTPTPSWVHLTSEPLAAVALVVFQNRPVSVPAYSVLAGVVDVPVVFAAPIAVTAPNSFA